jgi:hypothetical protein
MPSFVVLVWQHPLSRFRLQLGMLENKDIAFSAAQESNAGMLSITI